MNNIDNYDLIVVGSGFTGGICAYLAASKNNQRVLILEKRNHIAGNMFDEKDPETGILVQKYGPHSFHTNSKQVYNLITEIGKWHSFILRARVDIDGTMTPSPFNFSTIDTFFSQEKALKIKRHIYKTYPGEKKTTILKILKSKDPFIREYAEFLFEKDYKPYTVKQWGITPEALDVSVLARVPIRFDYTDQYFDDVYQLMPENGYASFFESMLNHPNIDIKLNTDAQKFILIDTERGYVLFNGKILDIPVVYTGALDELLEYRYGRLPYRSLEFRYETLNMESFQETPGVAYPLAQGYTRISEYTKLPLQNGHGKTVIAYEYPMEYENEKGHIPYYPVLTDESKKLYKKYLNSVIWIRNFFPCGRLADFRYYNMDNAIERAMDVFHDITFFRRSHWQRPVEKTLFSGDHFKEIEHIQSTLVFGDLSRKPAPITVVIPTFDRVDYFEECLKSVLEQTASPDDYDILVVDNEPSEGSKTEALMRRYHVPNIYYYRNSQNLGTYPNFNRCFQLARSKWVSMVHDDDWLVPTCIDSINNVLKRLRRKNIGYVMSGRIDILEEDPYHIPDYWDMTNMNILQRFYMWLKIINNKRLWKITLHDFFIIRQVHLSSTCGVLYNRDAVLTMGGFGREYANDDSLFLAALGEKYDCYYCGGIWGKYRLGNNNGWMKDVISNFNGEYMLREFISTYKFRYRFYSKQFRRKINDNAIDYYIDYVKCFDNGYTLARSFFSNINETETKKIQYVNKPKLQNLAKKFVSFYVRAWRFWIVLRAALFGIRYRPLPGEDIATYIKIAKRCHVLMSELSYIDEQKKAERQEYQSKQRKQRDKNAKASRKIRKPGQAKKE